MNYEYLFYLHLIIKKIIYINEGNNQNWKEFNADQFDIKKYKNHYDFTDHWFFSNSKAKKYFVLFDKTEKKNIRAIIQNNDDLSLFLYLNKDITKIYIDYLTELFNLDFGPDAVPKYGYWIICIRRIKNLSYSFKELNTLISLIGHTIGIYAHEKFLKTPYATNLIYETCRFLFKHDVL